MSHYDYLIVGAGLFGATFAYEAMLQGKSCLVIDKRNHIGGNIFTENADGITIHAYGAHIFHTSNWKTWAFINLFAQFNNFINSPIAVYKGDAYNLPFNMNTFSRIFQVTSPDDARRCIEADKIDVDTSKKPSNLEEQAISLVGPTIYKKLIKEYTEKQWGMDCKELPAWIIKRLPLRFTYDNNYFNDTYQGIPIGGYTPIIEKMLVGADIILNADYFDNKDKFDKMADIIVYTGKIDQYFNYRFGHLDYRSLSFETRVEPVSNYQGNAVINYTSKDVPYTREIEHKFFECLNEADINKLDYTYITRETPVKYKEGMEPYYPINDEKNMAIYKKYKELAQKEPNVIFGGRLAEYKYYDMGPTIERARSYWQ